MGNEILIPSGGVIGEPKSRVDGRLKVTGGARYSAEIPIQQPLHAVLVMSTIGRGHIVSMNVDEANAQPGVRAVITPFNAPRVQAPPSPGSAGARPQDRQLSLLQNTDVHYNNQPIGIVVADTLEAAQQGASLVKVIYAADQPSSEMDSPEARALIYKPKKAGEEPIDSHRGDPDGELTVAPKKIEHNYVTPIENHNPMEPHATIAVWDGPSKLTVYDATQGIFGVQSVLAEIFQLPNKNVRVLTYFVGGGFGCKGSAWSHVPLTVLAAKVTGRPVKLVLRRQHMFGMVGYRPRTEQSISLGATPDGKLTALKHDVYTQTSKFDEFVESSAIASRMIYSCDNVGTTHRLTRLDLGTPTFMRAPGESTGTFAIETAMDELSYELGMDPLALRLANYSETDQDKQKPYSSKSLKECYAVGAQRFNWARRNPTPRSMKTPDGLLIGLGMATATYPVRRSPASALARYKPDGTALVTAGSQDIGTGTYTVMKQIASDALGIAYEKVDFQLGDTNFPPTPVSGGSQTAASTGSAVLEASYAAKQSAIIAAVTDKNSPLFGVSSVDVDIKDGRLYSKPDPGKGETVQALLLRQKLPHFEETVQSKPDHDKELYSMHSFGAVFTEVHVDPDLGQIRVAHVTGAYAVGNRLNAKTANSQLIGGMVFGIGMALMEETHIDPRFARVMNPDLAEYHVPVNADVPALDVIFVDERDPHINPLGIKGIGEIGITGIVGSLCNAVYHATGVRVRELPITLDKVLMA